MKYSYSSEDKALKGVSFKVDSQEWISIIGHNGSGKSTISKLLIGLLKADEGKIFYDGIELTEETVDEIRKNVGIVFQNPDNQFVGYNVKYDVAFGLENRRVEREKMLDLINKYTSEVNMSEYLSREPSTLSGGQKQRVAIAGILAMDLDNIILDEATSMLDPKGTADIINLIKKLKNDYHKTIITITHDLNLAALSDRIIVLREGEIIASGTPFEIFAREDILTSSNLTIPFNLRLYKKAKENEKIAKNGDLMDLLWKLSLQI